MTKYDVFISCKSEDYPYAESIYDFLKEEGFNVFLASKELRALGESEYRRSISLALKEASHIIVFASKAEYVDSTWVYYEWDLFLNAKLKGKKEGNIITILKDVRVDDIPMDLWKYESFEFGNYKDSLKEYVRTPEYESRILKKEELKKHEAALERERREKEERQDALKKEIIEMAKAYKVAESKLKVELTALRAKVSETGVTSKKCPICSREVELAASHCRECGCWHFSPLEGIPGAEYLVDIDEETIERFQDMESVLTSATDYASHNTRLIAQNWELSKEIIRLKVALEAKNKTADSAEPTANSSTLATQKPTKSQSTTKKPTKSPSTTTAKKKSTQYGFIIDKLGRNKNRVAHRLCTDFGGEPDLYLEATTPFRTEAILDAAAANRLKYDLLELGARVSIYYE